MLRGINISSLKYKCRDPYHLYSAALFCFTASSILSCVLASWRYIKGPNTTSSLSRSKCQGSLQGGYSFIGDDYPLEYPIELIDPVAMTLHETIHFSLNSSDKISIEEWKSLARWPEGFGRTRLGPHQQIFVLVFYHQLHCLWKFQSAIVDPADPAASSHHVQHCLNYLRQTFLCGAADDVEEGDFMLKDFETERVGDTLVCQDWNRVFEDLDQNHERWLEWRKQWN